MAQIFGSIELIALPDYITQVSPDVGLTDHCFQPQNFGEATTSAKKCMLSSFELTRAARHDSHRTYHTSTCDNDQS